MTAAPTELGAGASTGTSQQKFLASGRYRLVQLRGLNNSTPPPILARLCVEIYSLCRESVVESTTFEPLVHGQLSDIMSPDVYKQSALKFGLKLNRQLSQSYKIYIYIHEASLCPVPGFLMAQGRKEGSVMVELDG